MRKAGLIVMMCLLALSVSACKEEKKADPAQAGMDDPSPAAAADPDDDQLPKDASAALPPGLLVDGQPVDPFCFVIAQNTEDGDFTPVNVRNCVSDEFVPGERFSKGPQSYGIDFQYASDADGMSKPYMLYQYVGRDLTLPPSQAGTTHPLPGLNEKFPVILYSNTGGTGNFSTLMSIKREGDTLKLVESIAGGDRCNGGVAQAIIDTDGALVYEQNITPYDMVVLGGDPERPFLNSVKAFDDLEACAVCCAGTAVFKNDQFTGVKLSSELAENIKNKYMSPIPPEQEKQACFDKALGAQIEKGKTEFSVEEWADVIGAIEKECLGGAESL